MGLDMYLTAEKYVSGWRGASSEEELSEYDTLIEKFDMADYVDEGAPNAYVTFTVGYWRKANHIHSWFVRECQDGLDECQKTSVEIEKLKELRDICLQVMASTKLVPGKVYHGTVYNKEHPKGLRKMEPGQVMDNTEVAEELLAPQDGFFFGSTDYDENYWDDLQHTVEIIDRCIALSSSYWDFEYRSSW